MRRVTFFCIGPGETIQAVGLAKALSRSKIECSFITTDNPSAELVEKSGYESFNLNKKPPRIIKNSGYNYSPEEAINKIEEKNADVLIICNSKAYSWGFIERPPSPKPVIVSLDSNWLFGQREDVKMPDWIDNFLITFPEKVYKKGLEHYEIPRKYLDKIIPVGFIPSWKISRKTKKEIREKFSIKRKEKLIFTYSGIGGTHENKIMDKVFKALDALHREKGNFKLVYTAPEEKKRPWAIFAKDFLLNPENFNRVLGSSDLVIAHQGLSTLFQAIANRTPIISNIPPKGNYHSGKYHSSFYEIKVFEELGLCKALLRDLPYAHLLKEAKNLLYNKKSYKKLRSKQKEAFKPGEKKALRILNKVSGDIKTAS